MNRDSIAITLFIAVHHFGGSINTVVNINLFILIQRRKLSK